MSVRQGTICGHIWTHMPVHEEATLVLTKLTNSHLHSFDLEESQDIRPIPNIFPKLRYTSQIIPTYLRTPHQFD